MLELKQWRRSNKGRSMIEERFDYERKGVFVLASVHLGV